MSIGEHNNPVMCMQVPYDAWVCLKKENGQIDKLYDCLTYLFATVKSLSELSFNWNGAWNALAVQVIGMIQGTWRRSNIIRTIIFMSVCMFAICNGMNWETKCKLF